MLGPLVPLGKVMFQYDQVEESVLLVISWDKNAAHITPVYFFIFLQHSNWSIKNLKKQSLPLIYAPAHTALILLPTVIFLVFLFVLRVCLKKKNPWWFLAWALAFDVSVWWKSPVLHWGFASSAGLSAADSAYWFQQQWLSGIISGNFFELLPYTITNPIHYKMFSFALKVG